MDFIIILIVLAVIAFIVIAINNSIITAFNSTKRSWADVNTYERQKVNILDSLTPIVSQYISYESETLKHITALRQSIVSLDGTTPDGASLEKIQAQTEQVLKGLSITVENYPDLKGNTVYLDLMKQITVQNENVGAAISIFNRNVEIFNSKIETFPTNVVNGFLAKKQRITEFKDSTAEKNIEFKPNF